MTLTHYLARVFATHYPAHPGESAALLRSAMDDPEVTVEEVNSRRDALRSPAQRCVTSRMYLAWLDDLAGRKAVS